MHLAAQGSKTVDICFVFKLYHNCFSNAPNINDR